jgi:hypothetical protein
MQLSVPLVTLALSLGTSLVVDASSNYPDQSLRMEARRPPRHGRRPARQAKAVADHPVENEAFFVGVEGVSILACCKNDGSTLMVLFPFRSTTLLITGSTRRTTCQRTSCLAVSLVADKTDLRMIKTWKYEETIPMRI